MSGDLYCWACGRLLVEGQVRKVRAYEFDTLYFECEVCPACEWMVKRDGKLEVQHEETMFVLRPCPHHC